MSRLPSGSGMRLYYSQKGRYWFMGRHPSALKCLITVVINT